MRAKLCLIFMLCTALMFTSCKKVEETIVEEEYVLTINGVGYNLERFNLYFYNAQDEILKASGFSEATDIPEDFWEAKVSGVTMLEMAKSDALDMIISDALEYEKAKEYGIELSSQDRLDINNQMSALKQDKVSLAQFEYIGISVKEMQEYYESERLIPQLLIKLMDEGEINISDSKMLEYYNSTYVKVKQIYIPKTDAVTGEAYSSDRLEYADKKAAEAMERLANGEEFDEIMAEFSEDKFLWMYAGILLFKSGEMEKEVEEVAFGMQEDEISGLIHSSDGIYIMQRLPLDLSDSPELARLQEVALELAKPECDALVNKWRAQAEIEINESVLKDLKPSITNSK